jgi:hypothetical protein
MKQFLFSLIAVTLVFSFTSCTEPDDDNGGPNNPDVSNQDTYVGTLTVDQLNGTFYVMDSVSISMTANDTTNTMNMVMYQVKFSSRMPLKLDMTVWDIAYVSNQHGYVLSGDSIVPFAMGGPFPDYTITQLNGTIENDSLTLSMNCGRYPLTFKGRN